VVLKPHIDVISFFAWRPVSERLLKGSNQNQASEVFLVADPVEAPCFDYEVIIPNNFGFVKGNPKTAQVIF